ncbi:Hypothetical protein SMAX5B_000107 [Scophthalmus maximus]|uniref:Uncharacterized protein n=1 Tax=Scophthalmus maximus TaxID=52904 RepID=A0A2U9CUT3_SCOMX|nr:Hypothetical protein SMAX5B_000107 [Scophthalmus maximus]
MSAVVFGRSDVKVGSDPDWDTWGRDGPQEQRTMGNLEAAGDEEGGRTRTRDERCIVGNCHFYTSAAANAMSQRQRSD